jgi:hypothetical protein
MLNNARGFAHIGALVVGFLVVCFVGYFAKQQIAIYNERKTYREAEVQITQFTNAAAKLAPSTKEIRKYCSYSSAKYSKGTLGCVVDGSIVYERLSIDSQQKIIDKATQLQENSSWGRPKNIVSGGQSITSRNNIKAYVYEVGSLSCSVDYEYKAEDLYGDSFDKSILVVEIGCSGPAAREYYPQ